MEKNTSNTIRAELVTVLLSRIEDTCSTKEALTMARELCTKSTNEPLLLKVSRKLFSIEKRYSEGVLTEHDAREEIAGVLKKLRQMWLQLFIENRPIDKLC